MQFGRPLRSGGISYFDNLPYVGHCDLNAHLLLRHKSTNPWPHSRNVVDVIKTMIDMGSNTIVFVGDSISMQHLSNAFSSLMRVGMIPDMSAEIPIGISKASFYVHAPSGMNISGSDVPFFQFFYLDYTGSKDRESFHPKYSSLITNITALKTVRGRILFIVNVGLHCQSPAEYDKALADCLPFFASLTAQHKVLFRETSAQHFSTSTGGYYEGSDTSLDFSELMRIQALFAENLPPHVQLAQNIFHGRVNNSMMTSNLTEAFAQLLGNTQRRCVPIRSYSLLEEQNWRNRAMRRRIAQTPIEVIPFFNLTAARHDLHVHVAGDCTHFCAGPMLWLPVWDAIYKSLVGEV